MKVDLADLTLLYELACLADDPTDAEAAAVERVRALLEEQERGDRPVMALGEWRNNAELFADVVKLGYLRPEWKIVDPTYGRGRFYTEVDLPGLLGSDLNVAKSPVGVSIDMRDLPYEDDSADAGVLDPGFKLNGTRSGPMDDDYGVDEWASKDERIQLALDGVRELVRVVRVGGYVLVKNQAMVNGGHLRWVPETITRFAEGLGCVKRAEFIYPSYRAQPRRSKCTVCGKAIMELAGGHGTWTSLERTVDANLTLCSPDDTQKHVPGDLVQKHPRMNYSTLLVYEVTKNKPQPPTLFDPPTMVTSDPEMQAFLDGAENGIVIGGRPRPEPETEPVELPRWTDATGWVDER